MLYEVGQVFFLPMIRLSTVKNSWHPLGMTNDQYDGRSKADVGARLELTRHAVGLDQQTFAAEAGLKASTYNQYETGKNMPQLAAAHALCDQYRLSLDWIYRGEMSGLSQNVHSAIASVRRMRQGS